MISKSHRPGVSLAWGDYVVSYVASDSFGNSASCTFELYVTSKLISVLIQNLPAMEDFLCSF